MRDTDGDWACLGEAEPYFGVLSHDRFLRHNLTDETLSEFWRSGAEHIDYVRSRIRHHFGDFHASNAIDFGSGVGRLTRAMAQHADHVTGVDIAPAMLAEGRRHALPNMEFVSEIPDGQFDWINSAMVFQHIHPDRGYDLFQRLINMSAPKAVLSVHFMVFKDRLAAMDQASFDVRYASWSGGEIKPLIRNTVQPGHMSMYDYDMSRILAMLACAGYTKLFFEHGNHGGCHGYEILAKRD